MIVIYQLFTFQTVTVTVTVQNYQVCIVRCLRVYSFKWLSCIILYSTSYFVTVWQPGRTNYFAHRQFSAKSDSRFRQFYDTYTRKKVVGMLNLVKENAFTVRIYRTVSYLCPILQNIGKLFYYFIL